MKRTLIMIIVMLMLFAACKGQDIKIFKGRIDYKFHLSSTDEVDGKQKIELEKEIEEYYKKRDLLSNYFSELNLGKTKEAEDLLKKDKSLSKVDNFTLSYRFMLLKMKELGILYKPLIQIDDETAQGIVISCTREQLEQLLANESEVELTAEYVGELLVDNVKAYRLISFQIK